jgi:hypothetical protein
MNRAAKVLRREALACVMVVLIDKVGGTLSDICSGNKSDFSLKLYKKSGTPTPGGHEPDATSPFPLADRHLFSRD